MLLILFKTIQIKIKYNRHKIINTMILFKKACKLEKNKTYKWKT